MTVLSEKISELINQMHTVMPEIINSNIKGIFDNYWKELANKGFFANNPSKLEVKATIKKLYWLLTNEEYKEPEINF